MMRIIALTDIHGSYSTVTKILQKERPDITIIGGDLTTVGTVKEAESAIAQFQELSPVVLGIAGNMDLPVHDGLFERLGISLHGHGRVIDGVGFFGCSASPHSPLHTPYEITEEEITAKIYSGYELVRNNALKVLVAHTPPYGTKVDIIHAGYNVGSTAVRDFIENEQPILCISGHIHEARGQDMLEKTRIINCGKAKNGYYGLIEIDNDMKVTNKQFL